MITGIGTDICHTQRIAKVYDRFGEKFITRLLTAAERATLPAASPATFLAKRFALKEAVAKALGCGIGSRLSFQDITISHTPTGRPLSTLSSTAQARFPGIAVHISLSDDNNHILAFAIAEAS